MIFRVKLTSKLGSILAVEVEAAGCSSYNHLSEAYQVYYLEADNEVAVEDNITENEGSVLEKKEVGVVIHNLQGGFFWDGCLCFRAAGRRLKLRFSVLKRHFLG
ncbi:hypothetical protein M5689_002273 [Euphorbia peplus]|nr:hypothetical protein M5689_002273 [Euphorbia peplus]